MSLSKTELEAHLDGAADILRGSIEEQGEEASPEGPDGVETGGKGGKSGLTAVQAAAKQIDEIYAAAPKGWQGMAQRKKKMRLQVALVVKALGMDGWMDKVPKAVEAYALGHYSGDAN